MIVFVFKCSKGHRVEVNEEKAEVTNATPCPVCYRPLLVAEVKGKR